MAPARGWGWEWGAHSQQLLDQRALWSKTTCSKSDASKLGGLKEVAGLLWAIFFLQKMGVETYHCLTSRFEILRLICVKSLIPSMAPNEELAGER